MHASAEPAGGTRDVGRIESTTRAVIGLDGCAAGWIGAAAHGVEIVNDVTSLLDRFEVVAIDIPIGLPRTAVRAADAQARRFLAHRASTIFSTPPRHLFACPDYAATNATSKQRHGRGVSRQAFAIMPKIAQIDALISPALEHRIIEVHPECSFREMAGHALESKHSDGGLRQREALVVERFGAIPLAPQGARRDDLLDAYATLWTATRFARGEHYEFGDGGRDDRGLLMRIVV